MIGNILTMNREEFDSFFNTQRRLFEKAKAILVESGINVDSIDSVEKVDENSVAVDFTFKWDSMYEKDSIILPVCKFLE